MMPDREKVIRKLKEALENAENEGEIFAEVRRPVLFDALALLKEQEAVVRCKDCDNKECWGRAGDVVCGIDGTPHRPDWFCADGVNKYE